MKSFVIILLFFVANANFAQNIKATYSVKLLKEIFSSDSLENMDNTLMVPRLNWAMKLAISEMKVIVISDNEKYQVYVKRPEIPQLTESKYDLAESLIIDGNYIHVDLQNDKSYYVPKDLDFTRLVETNNIQWVVTDSSRTISGTKANLAMPKIENQNHEYSKKKPLEGWYAPSINFKGGPNAYSSLPGLFIQIKTEILELTLDKIEFGDFQFIKFDPNTLKIKTHQEYIDYYEDWNIKNSLKVFR